MSPRGTQGVRRCSRLVETTPSNLRRRSSCSGDSALAESPYVFGLVPSVERRSSGDIVIVVDISGSIGTKELEQFSGEINAIANEAQPESIHVIYCDAAVQSEDEFALQRQSSCHPREAAEQISCRPSSGWRRTASSRSASSTSRITAATHFLRHQTIRCFGSQDSQKTAPFGETLRVRIVD